MARQVVMFGDAFRSKNYICGRSLALMNTLHHFVKDTRGNIAILFMFSTIALFGFAGAGLDFVRRNAVETALMESLDAAGLAIAQRAALDPSLSDPVLKSYGQAFFAENFSYANQITGLAVDFALTPKTITPSATGDLKTVFLGVFGISSFNTNINTTITRREGVKIELALILDNTASMDRSAGGVNKTVALQDAVTNLLDILFAGKTVSPNVKVGVVPFVTAVNVKDNIAFSGSAWIDGWNGATPRALYHGARFFHTDQNGVIDLNRKVSHFDLFDSTDRTRVDWAGCVENRPYPLDELDTRPGITLNANDLTAPMAVPTGVDATTRQAFASSGPVTQAQSLAHADNSKWVPFFAADEPDCDYGACSQSQYDRPYNPYTYLHDEVIGDRNYTTNSYSTTVYQKYADIVSEFRQTLQTPAYNPTFRNYLQNTLNASNRNRDEFLLRHAYVGYWNPGQSDYDYKYDLPLTVDETTRIGDARNEGPNFGCPAAIVALTDRRLTLDSVIPKLTPRYGGGTNTAIGLMWGWRVLSPTAPFTEGAPYLANQSPNDEETQKIAVLMTDGKNESGSEITGFGYPREHRLSPLGNRFFDSDGENDDKTLRICHRMKENDIRIFTIVFDVPSGSNIQKVMKTCSTDPATDYFDASNAQALEDAFEAIANELVALHVSK